ncbi:MAG: 16S rRNA (uracil(1498)-N(3))-methyltransferase [Wenzhouxiangella sp.]
MRLNRIHTEKALHPETEVCLDGGAARHLLKVLRKRIDDELIVFCGDGQQYPARITAIHGRQSLTVMLGAAEAPATESPLSIELIQAIGRGERMDYAIQKAVELGVRALQPLFSARTEVRLSDERVDKRLAHWQQVVIAACEQSGRVRVPEVKPPETLADLKKREGLCLYLHPGAELSPTDLASRQDDRITLLIGPEGGLAEEEIDHLQRLGFQGLRLGPRVLRTESAGPAAIAMLQTLLGDWR